MQLFDWKKASLQKNTNRAVNQLELLNVNKIKPYCMKGKKRKIALMALLFAGLSASYVSIQIKGQMSAPVVNLDLNNEDQLKNVSPEAAVLKYIFQKLTDLGKKI